VNAPEYLFEASTKPSLPWREVPLIRATEDSVKGYGCLVDDPDGFEIEIVRWPQQGWRPVDEGTGDEGGWVEGVFSAEWRGDVLFGANEAVQGNYVLGWSTDPQRAREDGPTAPRDQVLLWHMNYHPDGGQMFWPLDRRPFIVPAAVVAGRPDTRAGSAEPRTRSGVASGGQANHQRSAHFSPSMSQFDASASWATAGEWAKT
jgi:hypothetical protein